MSTRVVVTGIGTVSQLFQANDIENYILKGDSKLESVQGSELNNLVDQLEEFVPYRLLRRMCRFSQLALYSNVLCQRDSNLDIKPECERIGSIMNTMYGPIQVTERFLNSLIKDGPQNVSPTDFANTVMNCATGQVSMFLNLKGVSTTLVGSSAITYAYDLLKNNKADAIFVSGVEELNENVKRAFQLKDCSISENSYCILLERYEHAIARNAKIYSEIVDTSVRCGNISSLETAVKEVTDKLEMDTKKMSLTVCNSQIGVDENQIKELGSNFKQLFNGTEKLGYTLGVCEIASVLYGILLTNNKIVEDNYIVSASVQHGKCCSAVVQRSV